MILNAISILAVAASLGVIYRFGHRYGNMKMIEWDKDNTFCNNDELDD